MLRNKCTIRKTKELQETIRDLEFQLFHAIEEIKHLRGEKGQLSTRYLAACRSVGGITLPPGQ